MPKFTIGDLVLVSEGMFREDNHLCIVEDIVNDIYSKVGTQSRYRIKKISSEPFIGTYGQEISCLVLPESCLIRV